MIEGAAQMAGHAVGDIHGLNRDPVLEFIRRNVRTQAFGHPRVPVDPEHLGLGQARRET